MNYSSVKTPMALKWEKKHFEKFKTETYFDDDGSSGGGLPKGVLRRTRGGPALA